MADTVIFGLIILQRFCVVIPDHLHRAIQSERIASHPDLAKAAFANQ